MREDTSHLHIRLQSCLQAILDLEAELKSIHVAAPLLAEFTVLKDICSQVESIVVEEADVRRIESATAKFFKELDGAVGTGKFVHPEQRFLQ